MEDTNTQERWSDHKHAIQVLKDLRFHKSVYLPQVLLDLCYSEYNKNKGNFVLSQSDKKKVGCDAGHDYEEEKMVRLANSLTIEQSDIFEVLAEFDVEGDKKGNHYIVKRFIVRTTYDMNRAISIVFSVEKTPLILTAWLNAINDTHENLNRNLYVQSKKDRQERVKNLVNSQTTVNEIFGNYDDKKTSSTEKRKNIIKKSPFNAPKFK